ncbi:MAG: hypothetical protein Q9184_005265 [Pyrenodesmia sp. 2 TL-2023]
MRFSRRKRDARKAYSSSLHARTMLFAILELSLLFVSLHGLSIPTNPSAILQPDTDHSTFLSPTNLTANDDWPPIPFTATYFNDRMAIKFLVYGTDIPAKFAPQATSAFDAIIHQLVISGVDTFHPSDSPLVNIKGLVGIHVVLEDDISALKVAITLQAVRDLMDFVYGPRNIVAAEFGSKEPWKPLGKLAVSREGRPTYLGFGFIAAGQRYREHGTITTHSSPHHPTFKASHQHNKWLNLLYEMSSSSIFSISRTTTSAALLRRSTRGYCWGRHRWSFDTYPKSMLYQDPRRLTDVDRSPYRRARKDLSSYNYLNLPREIGRPSSSWARWKSQWNDIDRDHMAKHKTKADKDYSDWFQHFDKVKKDTADMHRLLKERIEADPFDAIFGSRFLYPDRATWWSSEESPRSPKATQDKHDSQPKQRHDTDKGGQRQQQPAVSPSNSKVLRHMQAPSSGVSSTTSDRSTVQGYVIDPITMRKIPQESANQSSKRSILDKDAEISYDIPVKRFDGTRAQQSSRTPNDVSASYLSAENSNENKQESRERELLKQEGFGNREEVCSKTKPNEANTNQTPPQGLSNDSARESGTRSSSVQSGLTYNPEENKTEDIDLLRASDVRASSGLGTRPKRETEVEKRQRRDRLEWRFDENLRRLNQSEGLLRELVNGLVEIKQARKEANARKAYEAYEAGYAKEISEHKAAMEAMQTRQSEAPTSSVASTHVHAEQGEGDMAGNVHEYATRERWYKQMAPHAARSEEPKGVQAAKDIAFIKEIRGIYEDTYGTIDTRHRQSTAAVDPQQSQEACQNTAPNLSLDQKKEPRETGQERKKASPPTGPLSSQEKMGTLLRQLLDDLQHMQKLVNKHDLSAPDRSELFFRHRNMRNASDAIAEALSTTSTKHSVDIVGPSSRPTTQPAAKTLQEISKPEAQCVDGKRASMVYSVLAYDPSTQQVTTAEMSSSGDSPSERRLSLSEALSSLTEPAKFLPHLTTLQSQGYEIVSSDTNILVLRKSHKPQAPPSSDPSPVAEQKPAVEEKGGRRSINPIDGTTTQTGNFASPTGFVNHDSPLPLDAVEKEEAQQQPSSQRVRRREDVFSGPSGNRWATRQAGDAFKQRSKFRRGARGKRTAKRMMWVSLWTASCCYAVGAITEYLRA